MQEHFHFLNNTYYNLGLDDQLPKLSILNTVPFINDKLFKTPHSLLLATGILLKSIPYRSRIGYGKDTGWI